MRAAVFERVGAPMTIEEIAVPKPRRGEVLVKVAACGICHSDLHVIKGELGFPLPCVLGHEISGTVADLGPDVTEVKVGDRVVASFIIACGRCVHCVRGRDDLCETFFAMNRLKGVLYDGETRIHRRDGSPLAMYSMSGLAEYAVVPVTDVFLLADGIALEEAAIMGCAVPTAYGAVRHQGEVSPGQTVAVIGVGGVGSNIVQFASIFGASDVIAVDLRDEKLEAAKALGATLVVNASRDDSAAKVRELTDGRGADVVFEALGRSQTVLAAFNAVRDGGRVVVVGLAPTNESAPIEITRLVRRSVTVKGSYGARMRTDVPEIIRLAAAGRFDPATMVTRRYPLAEAGEAYAALDRGEVTGRAIVVMGS